MKIDICIITKLIQDKYFKLIDSINNTTDESFKKNLNFYVCYTGDSPTELQQLDQALVGYEHHSIVREYHFSKNCNELAKMGDGDYVMFLNDDVEFVDDNTIQYMVDKLSASDDVGLVGLKLLYYDDTIQHYGQTVIIDDYGNMRGVGHFGWHKPNQITHDIYTQGVTAACIMLKKDDFFKIGGFNENYLRAFQDVELSWMIRMLNKKVVCVGEKQAYHYESVSRGSCDCCQEDIRIMLDFWNRNKDKLIDFKLYPTTIVKG